MNKEKIVSGNGELGFWLFWTLILIAWVGEPDLIDALIYWLMK